MNVTRIMILCIVITLICMCSYFVSYTLDLSYFHDGYKTKPYIEPFWIHEPYSFYPKAIPTKQPDFKTSNREIPLNQNQSETAQWLQKMENRYADEIQTIKSVCKRYHEKSFPGINLKDLMIDNYFHWGYCPNAKVGTSTWVEHFVKLMRTEKRPDRFDGSFGKQVNSKRSKLRNFFRVPINSVHQNYGSKLITKSILSDYLVESSILMFSFVRHPFERLVSTYTGKVVGRNKDWLHFNLKSFPDFIQFVLKQHKEGDMNKHVKPFVERCQYCKIPYDVIGRIETFDEDVKYIIMKNKLEDVLPLEETLGLHKNEHGKNTTEERERHSLELFSELDKQEIQQLYEIYKMDFEMFRYNVSAYFRL